MFNQITYTTIAWLAAYIAEVYVTYVCFASIAALSVISQMPKMYSMELKNKPLMEMMVEAFIFYLSL